MGDFDAHKWFKKQYLAEDSLNDQAKRYFLQKVSRGEIDTLPENPKEEFLKQMMKDQMDHDEETLRRERGLEEEESEMTPEEEHEHVKNLLKRNFMDESEARINEMHDRQLPDVEQWEDVQLKKIEEAIDFNDPALMKARAAKMAAEKEKAKQAALDKKYGSSFMDKLDAEINLKNELSDLDDEREQLMIDMEQEAEPEGGEIADRYGARLNSIEQRMIDIKSELDDLRMYESVNENNEELLKEFTRYGGDFRDSYANRLPEEQLTSTDDYELFMEMFPRGEASRILMDPNRKKLYDQHLEWTKDSQYNNTFVHMQYHDVEYEGEPYRIHQTQYYNTNYDDFRNPRFTELMISKDGKRMGTYLVDTTEYIKDLKNLDVKKRVSEGTCGYGEDGKIGDKPAGPHLNEDEMDTDVGGSAKQDDEELDIKSSSDSALDSEVNKMGYAESKEFNFKKMIKEALTPDYLK